MEKKKPGIAHAECGYFISSPIYAGINNTYLSHWQQTSPSYYRLGNLLRWVNKNITNKEKREYLTLLINKKR